MRIYFDDLTLAYNTLINKASRIEYDDYISSHRKLSSMWEKKRTTDDDEDEETRKRRQERGKRRFEEDFDHVNEEFFTNFQSRTAGAAGGSSQGRQNADAHGNDSNKSKNKGFDFDPFGS